MKRIWLLIGLFCCTLLCSGLLRTNFTIHPQVTGSRDDSKPLIKLATSLQTSPIITLGEDTFQVTSLGYDNFEDTNWEQRWQIETSDSATASLVDGKLRLSSTDGGINAFYTAYNKGEFPQNFIVRFKAGLIDAGKFSLLLAATHVRNQDNTEYVIGTFFGNDIKHNQNLRRYRTVFDFDGLNIKTTPPPHVLFEDTSRIATTREKYEIAITVNQGVISYYLNNILVTRQPHEHPKYSEPFDGGKFYVRTNKSTVWYDDFEFFEIVNGT